MIRAILIAAPLPALLMFPAPFFMLLTCIASIAFPPAGILYGVLADALYFAPGAASVPQGIIYGTAATLAGFLISRFFSTRVAGFGA
ncbi:MAG: hypothetical protein KBC38_03100 [Candidatus Pacebacteria bacterium]|nr:hypothetical protein [Candidatus Paceibacterota bacterium]MBP9840602.1 hypothetical protein [Candidatus Paceibacterota bacterium]